jgi:hypothetical protein
LLHLLLEAVVVQEEVLVLVQTFLILEELVSQEELMEVLEEMVATPLLMREMREMLVDLQTALEAVVVEERLVEQEYLAVFTPSLVLQEAREQQEEF